jgi:phosphatidylglycerol:prolipoprotein diacylglycerol transferase
MHPELAHLGPITFHSFGLLVALAFGAGLSWTYWRAKAKGLTDAKGSGDPLLILFMAIMLAGILGARLTYLVFYPDKFWADPIGVLFASGGLVWYGGVIAVLATIGVFCKLQRWSFWTFMDAFGPAVALGQAIGRIGCFLAGCCYGSPCPVHEATSVWHAVAVQYPPGHITHPAWVYPTPLFESLLMLALCAVLIGVESRQKFAGQLGLLMIAGYALVRFVLEYIRGDRLVAYAAWDLSASQVISVGLLLATLVLWVWRSAQTKTRPFPGHVHPLWTVVL